MNWRAPYFIRLAVALVTSSALHAGFLYPGSAPSNRLWPTGVVPYVIDPALTPAQRQTYLDGIREWELAGAVQFIPRTTEADYVYLKYDPLGPNRVSGSQPQIVEINALTRSQICHEMGHSLGLNHEMIRPDRNDYVNVLTQNISAGNSFWFDIDPNGVMRGTYDFESVMHFSRDLFSIQPGVLDVLVPKPGYERHQVRMGNFALSPGDRAAIAWSYGPVSLAAVVTHTGDTGPGSLRAALYHATDHPGTVIRFNIPVSDAGYSAGTFTIRPTGHLPPLVTHGTVVDATTQPGYAGTPVVIVDGSSILAESGDPPGLMIYAANCTIKGMSFTRSKWVGLAVLHPEATGNRICDCWTGPAPGGNTAHANAKQGIQISDGAHGNIIGPGNVISGNQEYGVWMSGTGTTENIVTGNRIGTNAAGNAALANGIGGLIITAGADGNIVSSGNIISGNTNAGIWLAGDVENTLVEGNHIGLGASGNHAVPNSFAGIYVVGGASNNRIRQNVISGNVSEGLRIADPGSSGNRVEWNLVGTDSTGLAAMANGFAGLTIFDGAAGNLLAHNLVSGNTSYGIVIGGLLADGNEISGNLLGVRRDGAALGNGFAGLAIWGGARDSVVSNNLIRHQGSYGIALFDAATTGHQITRNSISSNGFLGIGIGPANRAQAAPQLTSGVAGGTGLNVSGSLASTPGQSFRIEVFANPAPGNEEGARYLGSIDPVLTNASGNASFNQLLTTAVISGETLTATAIRSSTGDSSGFSLPVTVTITDADEDGMPDSYETTHSLNPSLDDALADADGDGFSNIDEYRAGTHPGQGASFPGISEIDITVDHVALTLRSSPGRTYRIEAANSPEGPWVLMHPAVPAEGPTLELGLPLSGNKGFFRARLAD